MKIKLIFLLTVASLVAKAQWVQNGNNVYSAGKVGIGAGASTPSFLLDIATASSLEGVQLFHNNGKWVRLFSPNLTAGAFNGITNASDAGIVFGTMAGVNTADYGFVITPHMNSTSGLRMTSEGRIGIGTRIPANVLDVMTGFGSGTETTFFLGQDHNFAANTGRYGIGMSFKHIDGTTPGKQYFLNVWFGGERRRALAFDYLGNVGIGTDVPDAKLTVKGTVHTQEVRVDLTGAVAPDYVFAADYKLPSLAEVSDYIHKNKHLPEVPSASDMEANGVNLKEMNMILLKKIEELTLYVIEQSKKMDEQHKEILLLKKELERR
jgi:hypothetical protein